MEGEWFVSNALLHEKHGYFRIVPPDSPVTLHTRRIHHAFWGGDPLEAVAREEGAFRDGLRQFGRVLVAARMGEVGPDHVGNFDSSVDVSTRLRGGSRYWRLSGRQYRRAARASRARIHALRGNVSRGESPV